VCEKATKAICVLYNVGKMLDQIKDEVRVKKVTSIFSKIIEKKKILCSNEIQSTEFVAAEFCSD
jgi:hypothetical protein